ncbi:ThiF family adenylyltransferase [Lysobacter niastensis]|uniref:ThiF family adenylyltransferase n=1 Tax=Lysobacter niastensis TaxID=380629 RepID=A0ABS0B3D0_9GAMM|nr:ThiF family adenylyltransferase [Lysobacter niastensis]MBF6022981.1 ThiF family adenylyltransferase [Lysobacter niastensis]
MADGTASNTALDRGIERLFALLDPDREGLLSRRATLRGEVARFRLALPADYLGQDRAVDVSFPIGFPDADLAFRVMPSPDLEWPHVLGDMACLFGVGEGPASREPEALVEECVARFSRVVKLAMPSTPEAERQAEFQRELATYWGRAMRPDSRAAHLPSRPEHSTALWAFADSGRRSTMPATLLSCDQDQLARSLELRTGRRERMRAPAAAGFYAKLTHWPSPRPPTAASVLKAVAQWLSAADAEQLRSWATRTAGLPVRWLLLELPDTTPTQVLGIVLRAGDVNAQHHPAYGRRAGRRLPSAVARGASAQLGLCAVDVVAEDEIFSRNPEPGLARLRAANVLMIGVGSLGSPIARHLLRAGVGRLTLVDPKRMRVSNLGRHELGAQAVGQFKAHALAAELQKDFVTARVTSIAASLQEAMQDPQLFDKVDIVLVTTGELDSEAVLWEYKRRKSAAWIMVQAWAEPGGGVGHALVAPPGSFDAQPLFEMDGTFRFQYTLWPNRGMVPLPACGVGYVPAGPLAMGVNASLVANAVVRALVEPPTEPAWHTTVSEVERITSMGGTYIGPAPPVGYTQWTQVQPWPGS